MGPWFSNCSIDKHQEKVLMAEGMLLDYLPQIELIGKKVDNVRGYL